MAESVRRKRFEWRQVRVAALVVVGVILLLYGVYRIGKVFDVFASRYEIIALVPSGLGLREGAPVTLAGQSIGQVKEIGFIPVRLKTGDNNLFVRLAISEDVRDQIRVDSRAFMRTQGLLGDKFVDIEPGTPGAAILQSGDTIEAGPVIDVEEFINRAAVALDTANAMVADLRDITYGIRRGDGTIGRLLNDDQAYDRLVTTMASLDQMLGRINSGQGTLGRLMRDPALYDRLNATAARVDSLGALIVSGNGSLARLLRSDSLYDHIIGSVRQADSAITRLDSFVDRMANGQGTVQRLMQDPALYEEFLKAVIDMQTLIQAIRANPERFKPNIMIDIF